MSITELFSAFVNSDMPLTLFGWYVAYRAYKIIRYVFNDDPDSTY